MLYVNASELGQILEDYDLVAGGDNWAEMT